MQINRHFHKYLADRKRFLFLVGGAGSGKSRFAAQKILLRMMGSLDEVIGKTAPKKAPVERFLIVRKVKESCAASVYQMFKDLIAEEGLWERFDISKSEQKIVFPETGSELRCVGLDDPEKIKSIQGITSVWIEEATELSEADFLQLNLRLRGKDVPDFFQIILSLNPIDDRHWIKQFVENPAMNKRLTLDYSIYKDNAFLDEQYKKELEETYKTNENMYRVYVLGQWGVVLTGGEFYKNFRRDVHVRYCEYDRDLALHFSLDDNTRPYFPGVVVQIKEVMEEDVKWYEFRVIKEFTLKSPRNNTTWMSWAFSKEYRLHTTGVYIYGDATAQKEDVKAEKGIDMFQLVMNGLKDFHPERRVATSNPNQKSRGNWINDLLAKNPAAGNIRIMIDPSCVKTIDDFTFVKEDANGKKDKTEIREKTTGLKYQPYGHLTDCIDYVLCRLFEKEYINWQYGGRRHKILFQQKEQSAYF